MGARQFIVRVFRVSLIIILALVLTNYLIDLYGLFRSVKDRSITIYSDERTSKYLLAHRYVPENFDAYILGPSLSANIDPKQIEKYKIYNLSLMGANITEERMIVEKAMEKNAPDFVILCLHPYLTMDHGLKTGMITPQEYYGALGSISLYKAYCLKMIRDYRLMPSKYPPNQFNDYGFNNYEVLVKNMPVEEKIKEQLTIPNAIKTSIDTVAWQEFNELMDLFVRHDVKIIAYFHPLPRPLYEKYEKPVKEYQKKVEDALKDKASIIDFNDGAYVFFSGDLTNYIDHGHLSEKGQHFLLKEILKKTDML